MISLRPAKISSSITRLGVLLFVAAALLPSRAQVVAFGTTYASPQLQSVVSTITENALSASVPLSLNDSPPTVDSYAHTGGKFTFVCTFDQPIVSAEATLVSQTGTTTQQLVGSGDTVSVQATGLADGQMLEVLLTQVKSGSVPQIGSGAFRVRLLEGDFNGDGVVDAQDVALLEANLGTTTTNATLPYDLDGSGTIDAADDTLEKSLVGHSLAAIALSPQQEAARFLGQATLGFALADVNSVVREDESAWIARQFTARPQLNDTLFHIGAREYRANLTQGYNYQNLRADAWWGSQQTGTDLLRQRVAFALSEIFVVSQVDSTVDGQPGGLANFYDTLLNDAFTNYHQIFHDVTYHPIMGTYLTYMYNRAGSTAANTHPDENYAREAMQLFSIGLFQLNLDGTQVLDGNGNPIPTYSNVDVTNFARVYTGWTFHIPPRSKSTSLYGQPNDYELPMSLMDAYHDNGAKTLLSYSGSTTSSIAATTKGEAGSAEKEVEQALNNISQHPNVAPFVSRLLIQHLVTSNPSTDYIKRVATVFQTTGGDMKSVIKTILLDPEARDTANRFDPENGHLREPWVRLTHLAHAFDAQVKTPARPVLKWEIYGLSTTLGMEELDSPSVFNFYSPNYQPPGAVSTAGLVAPEFQITNASTLTTTTDFYRRAVFTSLSPRDSTINLNFAAQSRETPLQLVDNVDLLLTGGTLDPSTRATALNAVEQLTDPTQRAQAAVAIIFNSPDYSVQK